MNLKKIFFLPLVACSLQAVASPERCDFENVSGELFEFSQPMPIVLRHDVVEISESGKYPFWFKEANTDNPISVDSYFGRLAKVQSNFPVKRVSENTFKDVRERLYVNYYSAIADNCEQIYVRIVENDFPQYYSPKIDFVDFNFDFLEQERWLGITMVDNIKDLESLAIDQVTVRPEGHGKVVFVDESGSVGKALSRYESVDVLDVRRVPFYFRGEMLSNYSISVKYQGKVGYINADYRYLFNGNPLLDINPEFVNSIAKGKLSFGMSKDDVLLSWGMPSSTEVYSVYQNRQGFVVDYNDSLKEKSFRKVGDISHWKYAGVDDPIIFDVKGVMSESKQRFSRFDPMGLPEFIME